MDPLRYSIKPLPNSGGSNCFAENADFHKYIFSSEAKMTDFEVMQKSKSRCGSKEIRIWWSLEFGKKYRLSSKTPAKDQMLRIWSFAVIFALRRVLLAPPVIFASECYWASPSLLANITSLLRSRNTAAKQYHSGASRNITKNTAKDLADFPFSIYSLTNHERRRIYDRS